MRASWMGNLGTPPVAATLSEISVPCMLFEHRKMLHTASALYLPAISQQAAFPAVLIRTATKNQDAFAVVRVMR